MGQLLEYPQCVELQLIHSASKLELQQTASFTHLQYLQHYRHLTYDKENSCIDGDVIDKMPDVMFLKNS